MSEKVYCNNCGYLDEDLECIYKKNITKHKKIIKEDWFEPDREEIIEIYNRRPSEINKNNDCKWFVDDMGAKYD